jgi:hypothetical protein
MKACKVVYAALAVMLALILCLPNLSRAESLLSQALKVFGISYVVRVYGNSINNFINDLADQKGVKWEGTTKVVPIISIGSGTYVGAAQVQGPADKVDDVRAVGQLETRIQNFRGKLLIPVSTTNPSRNVERIQGVGVSSLIDFKL